MLRCTALAFALLVVLSTRSPAAPTTAQQDEVRHAYSLVVTTFYRKLEPRDVLLEERHALVAYTQAHGATSTLPTVPPLLTSQAAADLAVELLNAAVRSGVDAAGAETVALRAIASAAHDRYTAFFTPAEYKTFDEVLDPAKLSGIGILMDIDPATKFIRAFFVVPNTPADRAGMKSGDLIEAIDDASTRGWSIARAREHLLGTSGTAVRLKTLRPSEHGAAALALVREPVQPPTVYFTMLAHRIAYVYVAAFGNATPQEFHTAVERSEAQGALAYVVDVRDDGGGIVGTALSIASEFVPSGPLVSIESNGGEIDTYEADDDAISPKPLAVLVNGNTASSSEIMAAAISESGTGMLVGTKTFGKGVVQSVTHFADGSAIKITTGRYFTPRNHDINGRGLVPDVWVNENEKPVFGTPEKDAQLARALTVIEALEVKRGGNERTGLTHVERRRFAWERQDADRQGNQFY